MTSNFANVGFLVLVAGLAGCTAATSLPETMAVTPTARPSDDTDLERMITRYAAAYDVPPALVHRVVKRESTYNPKAYNAGNWGLMQIRYGTAQTMGYRGKPEGLLDAETNLKYAVKYLKGAYMVAGGDHDRAVRLYQRGYYYDAKRAGLLVETGLRPGKAGPATAVASADAEPAAEAPPASLAFSGGTPTARPGPTFRPRR